MYGPERLVNDLKALGLEVSEITTSGGERFAVIVGFTVSGGRFNGRVIDLAVQATADFPRTVASAIHVKADPQLYEITDTVPQVRNITDSVLGPEWRYWSNNFQWTEERSARRLLSQINGIFDRAE